MRWYKNKVLQYIIPSDESTHTDQGQRRGKMAFKITVILSVFMLTYLLAPLVFTSGENACIFDDKMSYVWLCLCN